MRERRAKGTGSLSEHRGRWRWRYDGSEGYCNTKRDAELRLRWLREQDAADDPQTVVRYVDDWLDARELEGRVRYVHTERRHVDAYVRAYPPFQTLALQRLGRKDCVMWLRWLEQRHSTRGRPLAKNTIRQIRAILSRALEDAADEELLADNPLRHVKIKGGTEKRPFDYLTAQEVEAVLALDLAPEQRAVIAVAIYTGLSPKEIWHLEWDSVDLEARQLHVRGIKKRSSRHRTIPLIRDTVPALKEWRAEQQRLAARKTTAPTRGGLPKLVFPRADGRPRGDTADPARWRAKRQTKNGKVYVRPSIPEQAGISRHIVFRDLRHTFASNIVSGSWGEPIDLHRLAYLMGHSDVAATQIYAHLRPEGPIESMRALDVRDG